MSKIIRGRVWRMRGWGISRLLEKIGNGSRDLAVQLRGLKGVDGQLDGRTLDVCKRGNEVFVYNSTAKPVESNRNGETIQVAPYTIWEGKVR